ncbi:hypothetical protein BCAH1134_C0144 (plasmid) [Bacillus cereus AH1134]|nr:hypothetical protein BCAH1134_C0144 [Bacillus cereus AH1134]
MRKTSIVYEILISLKNSFIPHIFLYSRKSYKLISIKSP